MSTSIIINIETPKDRKYSFTKILKPLEDFLHTLYTWNRILYSRSGFIIEDLLLFSQG